MNLSFRDLEYFLTLAELGHMGRAAAVHGITQPALSKSLRRLEEETGLTLFERSSRRLWLSASGLAFVEHARQLHAQYQDALRNTSALQAGHAGLLRIGATGVTLDAIVTPALTWLMPRRPALKACLTVGLSDTLFDQVLHGKLDLVVAPLYGGPATGLDHYVLKQDTMRIVLSARHPLLESAAPQLADTLAFPWILPLAGSSARATLMNCFAEQGLPEPRAAMEVPLISAGILEIVATTQFLSFAPEPLIAQAGGGRISALSFTLPQQRKLCLLARQGASWTPLMEAFRDAVEGSVATAQEGPADTDSRTTSRRDC